MFLKSWSSTGWQVFWALRSTGLRKGGTRWGTWRKLCKKSWLAWPANSCLTIYAGHGEEKWEIMTRPRHNEKGKIGNEGGLKARHVHFGCCYQGEREWCQIEWIHMKSIRAVVSIGLEVKHCNMLIWKWDLRRGKRRGGGSTILFPMQMIYDELPAWWSREKQGLATDDKRWSFCKTAPKVGQTHLAEHLGMATLSSFLTAAC